MIMGILKDSINQPLCPDHHSTQFQKDWSWESTSAVGQMMPECSTTTTLSMDPAKKIPTTGHGNINSVPLTENNHLEDTAASLNCTIPVDKSDDLGDSPRPSASIESNSAELEDILGHDLVCLQDTEGIKKDTHTPNSSPEEIPIASTNKSSKAWEVHNQEHTSQSTFQGKKDPYRDPIIVAGQTKFPSKPIRFYKYSNREPSVEHRNACPDILNCLVRCLQEHPKIDIVPEDIQFRLWMVGESKEAALPSIVVICKQKESTLVESVLCSTSVEKRCNLVVHPRPRVSPLFKFTSSNKETISRPKFHLHIMAYDPPLLKLYGVIFSSSDVQVRIADAFSWCGSRIVYPERNLQATLACILRIKGRYYGLTTAHAFRDILDRQGSFDSWYSLPYVSIATLLPRQTLLPDLDWALVSIPNIPRFDSAIFSIVLGAVVQCELDEDRCVLILSSSTDTPKTGILVWDTMYSSTTNGDAAVASWSVELDDGQGWLSRFCLSNQNLLLLELQFGDSGSLVIDAHTHDVYGYMIGRDFMGRFQVIPMHSTMDQIRQVIKSEQVMLVTRTEHLPRTIESQIIKDPSGSIFSIDNSKKLTFESRAIISKQGQTAGLEYEQRQGTHSNASMYPNNISKEKWGGVNYPDSLCPDALLAELGGVDYPDSLCLGDALLEERRSSSYHLPEPWHVSSRLSWRERLRHNESIFGTGTRSSLGFGSDYTSGIGSHRSSETGSIASRGLSSISSTSTDYQSLDIGPVVPGHALLPLSGPQMMCQCGTKFSAEKLTNNKSNYKRHLKSLSAVFRCEYCGRNFNMLENLRAHVALRHKVKIDTESSPWVSGKSIQGSTTDQEDPDTFVSDSHKDDGKGDAVFTCES